jgi:hypothetical protein
LADTEQRAARIFREVAPSVVLVVKAKRSPGLIGPNTADIRTASGFVWDAEGHNWKFGRDTARRWSAMPGPGMESD